MTTLENVEKLRGRANITYEEAKQALDACGGDLLDAMIYLESKGKIDPPSGGGSYSSTAQAAPQQEAYNSQEARHSEEESFGWWMNKLARLCKKLLRMGFRNTFEVWSEGELWFSVPIIVLVVLAFASVGFVIPVLIIGLLFGCSYRFKGRDIDKAPAVNKAMDSARKAAESVKREFNESYKEDKEELKEELRQAKDELKDELRAVEREIDELCRDDDSKDR